MESDLNATAYWRLARFDKPAGIILLWSPVAWALWLANEGHPSTRLVMMFFLGTVFMRAAGCVVNDIADRHIDLHVQRTKNRPLTSGEVSLQEACLFLCALLFCSLFILLQLPSLCFYYALAALFVTVLYPFCKRWLDAPQFILGLAFCMGIPMVYAASGKAFDTQTSCLLLINFLWVLAYDTQYAMTDRKDDLRIGVKSTAVLLAKWDRLAIGLLQITFHGLWFFLMSGFIFYSFWLAAAVILFYQQYLLAQGKCFRAFLSNSFYGIILWAGLMTEIALPA